jgi:ferritin-like protein
MRVREIPELGTKARPGDTTRRVGVDGLRARGIDPDELATRLTALALEELAADYRHAASGRRVLAVSPAAAVAERVARRARDSFELCAARIQELGASLPPGSGVPNGTDPASVFAATPAAVLEELLESERAGIRAWWELCDLYAGADFRTLALAQEVLGSKIEHEVLLIDALSAERERDGTAR